MNRWWVLMLAAPTLALAQEYFEASGQTVAFTLAPGAKAAWSQAASQVTPVARKAALASPLQVRYVAGELRLGDVGTGRLRLLTLQGREVGTYPVDAAGIARPAGRLGTGVWLARFEGADGSVRIAKLANMGGGK